MKQEYNTIKEMVWPYIYRKNVEGVNEQVSQMCIASNFFEIQAMPLFI